MPSYISITNLKTLKNIDDDINNSKNNNQTTHKRKFETTLSKVICVSFEL
jgi:hypothetical protein